jgi:hypothetical protein
MWFDLKNATIKIKDGFSGAAAVNHAAGYTNQSTITIDGYTGIIPTGTTFRVAGDTDATLEHTITAHTETAGSTTSITFTPPLSGTIADDAVITLGPRKLTIKVGEGNMSYNEKRNVEYKKDRGRLDTVRLGDEEPMDVSFEFWWEFIKSTSGENPSIEDVLKQRSEASDWITTSPDECEPYCVDIEVHYVPPCGDVDTELIELKYFRYEGLNHDLKGGTISCQGKCNITEATVTRVAT